MGSLLYFCSVNNLWLILIWKHSIIIIWEVAENYLVLLMDPNSFFFTSPTYSHFLLIFGMSCYNENLNSYICDPYMIILLYQITRNITNGWKGMCHGVDISSAQGTANNSFILSTTIPLNFHCESILLWDNWMKS